MGIHTYIYIYATIYIYMHIYICIYIVQGLGLVGNIRGIYLKSDKIGIIFRIPCAES